MKASDFARMLRSYIQLLLLRKQSRYVAICASNRTRQARFRRRVSFAIALRKRAFKPGVSRRQRSQAFKLRYRVKKNGILKISTSIYGDSSAIYPHLAVRKINLMFQNRRNTTVKRFDKMAQLTRAARIRVYRAFYLRIFKCDLFIVLVFEDLGLGFISRAFFGFFGQFYYIFSFFGFCSTLSWAIWLTSKVAQSLICSIFRQVFGFRGFYHLFYIFWYF